MQGLLKLNLPKTIKVISILIFIIFISNLNSQIISKSSHTKNKLARLLKISKSTKLRKLASYGTLKPYIKQFFYTLNQVRTNPKSLVPYLKKEMKLFKGKVLYRPGKPGLVTIEGANAYKILISHLENMKPVKPMEWSNAIAKACQLFVEDVGPKGVTGHDSSNGDNFWKRISDQGTINGSAAENLAYGSLNGKDSLIQ